MIAEVDERDSGEIQVLDDPGRRIGEQDLPAVTRRADARRTVDADAVIAPFMEIGLRRVETHPHADVAPTPSAA